MKNIKLTGIETAIYVIVLLSVISFFVVDLFNYVNWAYFIIGLVLTSIFIALMFFILKHYFNQFKNNQK